MNRIVAVTHSGRLGGAEMVLMRLLAEAVADGGEAVLCCPPGPIETIVPAGVEHVPLPPMTLGAVHGPRAWSATTQSWRWFEASRVLRSILRSGDIVLANSLPALPAVTAARPRGHVVWLVHNVIHRREWFALLRMVRSSVDTVIAVSEAAAAPLRERGLAVDVVRHGVPWPVAARENEPPTPVVGYAGLLTPGKGQIYLLEAFALLPDTSARLELAGAVDEHDGAYVARLHARADQDDLRGRVAFLGHVDAMERLRGWTVALSASVEPEAGPLVVLEAMSVGVPVLATGIGGSLEILGRGVGSLVPPNSPTLMAAALAELLADPQLRRCFAERGRSEIAKYYRQDVQIRLLLDAVTGG